MPSTNLQTKGDSITFQTPTIEGTIMRWNKLDGQGKHPWKTEDAITEAMFKGTARTVTSADQSDGDGAKNTTAG